MTSSSSPSSTLLSRLSLPPGHPGQAYILPSLCGEIIYIPCSKSATRLLVTGAETAGGFAVVGSGGTLSPPIGFHFHHDAHDVFLCIKGSVNVWADDQCRTMRPGDFASVPPGTVHQYQILGTHTEFLGLIVPGGWEEFFRFIGEPYTAGPLFPLDDPRNPFEVLIPKLKQAAEKFDMVPCPGYDKGAKEPQAWVDGKDNTLPGAVKPYFLRNDSGPAYLVGGGGGGGESQTLVRPLATAAESNGRFSIASLEGSDMYGLSLFPSEGSAIKFASTHHCFQVADGAVKFVVGEHRTENVATLTAGETVYVPAGTPFRFDWASRFAKMYAFSNGQGGIAEILVKNAGREYAGVVMPETKTKTNGTMEKWDLRAVLAGSADEVEVV